MKLPTENTCLQLIILLLIVIPMALCREMKYSGPCSEGQYYDVKNKTSRCQSCPSGTYMDQKDHQISKCKKCSQEDKYQHTIVIEKCNSTHDAQLGCNPGRFESRIGHHLTCDMCTKCGDNERKTGGCEGKVDTKCSKLTQDEVETEEDKNMISTVTSPVVTEGNPTTVPVLQGVDETASLNNTTKRDSYFTTNPAKVTSSSGEKETTSTDDIAKIVVPIVVIAVFVLFMGVCYLLRRRPRHGTVAETLSNHFSRCCQSFHIDVGGTERGEQTIPLKQ